MQKIIMPLLLASLLACSESPDDPVYTAVQKCSTEGQVGCVSSEDFPSVDTTTLTANIASFKTGNVFNGVTGTLADCSTEAQTSCIATSEFPSVVKADITASTLASGSSIAGVTGTFAPACSADAAVSCLANSSFKAVQASAYTAWDVRAGTTLSGIEGSSSFYRNAATLTTYNRTAGHGSNASTSDVDDYDSIDDNAAGTAIPVGLPTTAPAFVDNWVRDSSTDTDSDETCSGSEACVYNDLQTGLSWNEDDGAARDWETAITYCEGLTVGTSTDWRLPTQKELLQAYVNRIFSLKAALNLQTTDAYLSATTSSILTGYAWRINLGTGLSSNVDKAVGSPAERVVCVRP